MKLKDKSFMKFESVVLVVTAFCVGFLWFHFITEFMLLMAFVCLVFVSSVVSWRLYKNNQWYKLVEIMFVVGTFLLLILLFGFVWDYDKGTMPPADILPDEPKWLTNPNLSCFC